MCIIVCVCVCACVSSQCVFTCSMNAQVINVYISFRHGAALIYRLSDPAEAPERAVRACDFPLGGLPV